MLILDKFLGSNASEPSFTFDDFNTDFKEYLKSHIENSEQNNKTFPASGILLKLFIEYDEHDDLSNMRQ